MPPILTDHLPAAQPRSRLHATADALAGLLFVAVLAFAGPLGALA